MLDKVGVEVRCPGVAVSEGGGDEEWDEVCS